MIRKFLPVLIICILASGAVSYYIASKVIKNNNDQEYNYAKVVNEKELILAGNLRKYFHSSAPNDFINASKIGSAAVVGINAIQKSESKSGDQYAKSSGSGVIISNDGYIVSNHHVVESASEILIVLDDNREYKGKVVGTDPATDLALLKIEADNLSPLIYGNSDSLHVGEWVLAIGNPFKLQTTVTAGIVSAKARDINILQRQGIESFIQTDAAVNPGNSGGALVNSNGELVGINTAIISQSGGYEGFSFAVPVNLVQKVIYDIMEFGAVQRGWMGITIFNIDDKISRRIGLSEVSGIYVDVVERNSAAQEGGIKSGDVILSVNDRKTDRIPMFMEEIARHRPGDKISIEYVRDGQTLRTSVILRNQLNTTDYIAVRKDPVLLDLGFEIRDLDSRELDILPKKGVYVVSIYRGKTISETNMEAGYIITTMNGEPIDSADDLVKKLNDSNGKIILDGYYENYVGSYPYTFSLGK